MSKRIDEINARLAAATKGRWNVSDYCGPSGAASAIYRNILAIGVDGIYKGDAELIANARDDIQYLIAELENLICEEHGKLARAFELAAYWENEAKQLDHEIRVCHARISEISPCNPGEALIDAIDRVIVLVHKKG